MAAKQKLTHTYVVEGGIGKCLAFTSILSLLEKKANNKVNIVTPYTDVFQKNNHVNLIFDGSNIQLGHPQIQSSDDLFYVEPYKNKFALGKIHLIKAYCDLLGVQYNNKLSPKMFSGEQEQNVDKIKADGEIDKYIIVQFSGGQSPLTYREGVGYQNLDPGRMYPPFLAQQVINMLKEEYKNHKIINMCLPNEPQFENAIPLQAPFVCFHELLKGADGFISCDSVLNHMSVSAKKRGVVIWGSTRWSQFGYTQNQNVNYYMTNDWVENKFNGGDPRNIMVDPQKVVDLYKERETRVISGSEKGNASVHCMAKAS